MEAIGWVVVWILASVPAAVVLGKFIAEGKKGWEPPPAPAIPVEAITEIIESVGGAIAKSLAPTQPQVVDPGPSMQDLGLVDEGLIAREEPYIPEWEEDMSMSSETFPRPVE